MRRAAYSTFSGVQLVDRSGGGSPSSFRRSAISRGLSPWARMRPMRTPTGTRGRETPGEVSVAAVAAPLAAGTG